MTNSGKLSVILDLCINIEETAAEIYARLSGSAHSEALKNFWEKMVKEGNAHLKYWKRLKTFAERNELPDAFEDPDSVARELEERSKQIQRLLEQWEKDPSVGNAFVIAYRLEAYKLHPAFRTLFQYYRPMTDGVVPPETEIDETNINEFVQALHKYGEVTPELELVGETLQRLWDQNKALSQQAMVDTLTNLLNRRGFLLMARQMAHLSKRNKTPLSILIAEIDGFKEINETIGMQKGDEILKGVAVNLHSMLRGSDLLARNGGDEYIILLPNTPLEGGVSVAQKVREKIEKSKSGGVSVSVSIGVAEAIMQVDIEQELRSLIRYAEGNLIVAKTSGKNQVIS